MLLKGAVNRTVILLHHRNISKWQVRCWLENVRKTQRTILILFTLHDKSLNSSNNQCAGLEGGISSGFNCYMQNLDPVSMLFTCHLTKQWVTKCLPAS